MPEVTYDEIALTDERKVRAVIKRLGQPRLDGEWLAVAAFGRPLAELAFWEKYILDGRTYFVWRDKHDVWLTADGKSGVLRRVVISGLAVEKDAKVLRSDAWRTRSEIGQRLTTDEIKQLAVEVVKQRPARQYQELFRSSLRDIRLNFEWHKGEVVEAAGRILPIGKLSLRSDDIELLRQVYARLPRTTFSPTGEDPGTFNVRDEHCPLCGGAAKANISQAAPLADRKTSRNEVADAAKKDIRKADFMTWVSARLTDEDRGSWTHTRTLYQDYENWLAKRGDDQTVTAHGESKAAKMNHTSWGTLMGRMYAKRRNGRGNNEGYLYGVRLKKR